MTTTSRLTALLVLSLDGCTPDLAQLTSGVGGAHQLDDSSDGSVGLPAAGNSGAGGRAGSGGNAGSGGDAGSCTLDVAGDVAFSFDTALSGKYAGDWVPYPEGSAALNESRVSWSETQGHTCAGALQLTVPFETYGNEKVMALINFSANWQTPLPYGALHGWVKFEVPDGSALEHVQGVQMSVSSGNAYEAFRSSFLSASSFVDENWHELVVTLEPLDPPPQVGAFIPTLVRQIGVQLVASPSAPPTGPEAPIATTLFVDDLWLEPK